MIGTRDLRTSRVAGLSAHAFAYQDVYQCS